jgi:archaeosine-15-forming tRNA-guanine transglycosylase
MTKRHNQPDPISSGILKQNTGRIRFAYDLKRLIFSFRSGYICDREAQRVMVCSSNSAMRVYYNADVLSSYLWKKYDVFMKIMVDVASAHISWLQISG